MRTLSGNPLKILKNLLEISSGLPSFLTWIFNGASYDSGKSNLSKISAWDSKSLMEFLIAFSSSEVRVIYSEGWAETLIPVSLIAFFNSLI